MHQLPQRRWRRRLARTGARQCGHALDRGSARTSGDSGQRQHAGLRQELESSGSRRASGLHEHSAQANGSAGARFESARTSSSRGHANERNCTNGQYEAVTMSVSYEISNSIPVRSLATEISFVKLKTEIAFQPELRPSLQVKTITRTAREFLTLAKPEITLMVMISAGVSCLMASDSINLVVLAHTVLGTGLVAAGAASLNQFMERALDGNMRRTSRRPLPAGKLTATAAFVFGISLSAAGTIYLIYFLNVLTALLGLFTLFSYLFVYTPLKRKTTFVRWSEQFPAPRQS